MFNRIIKIKFSFKYYYFILLIVIGTFLISSAFLNENLIYDKFDYNYIKPKNLAYNYGINRGESIQYNSYQYNSYKQNLLANIDKQLTFSRDLDTNQVFTLPEDLHLIKDISTKKEKFINSILPLVIAENHKILFDRSRIIEIQNFLNHNKTLTSIDQKFIEKIAAKYSIKIINRHKVDIIKDLLDHVDVIPNSIVLAQAANESGWGSSRFARDFNALFGQYTYDKNNGVEPYYREDGEKYLIKFFPSINHSIESYFQNINTHFAYYDFRQTRKYLRQNHQVLNPEILCKKLTTYAKDSNYIQTIISIIKFNNLTQYDDLITI